jgi:hypothetical protein
MLFAGKWMDLENFMLSQKVKGCIFSLICEQTNKLNAYIDMFDLSIIYLSIYLSIYNETENKNVLMSV